MQTESSLNKYRKAVTADMNIKRRQPNLCVKESVVKLLCGSLTMEPHYSVCLSVRLAGFAYFRRPLSPFRET